MSGGCLTVLAAGTTAQHHLPGRQLHLEGERPAAAWRRRLRRALPANRWPSPPPVCPGLGHIFVLVWDEGKCGELPGPYRDAISCAWDSRRSQESANPFNDLLAKRW